MVFVFHQLVYIIQHNILQLHVGVGGGTSGGGQKRKNWDNYNRITVLKKPLLVPIWVNLHLVPHHCLVSNPTHNQLVLEPHKLSPLNIVLPNRLPCR